jgi:hypothetical protein
MAITTFYYTLLCYVYIWYHFITLFLESNKWYVSENETNITAFLCKFRIVMQAEESR